MKMCALLTSTQHLLSKANCNVKNETESKFLKRTCKCVCVRSTNWFAQMMKVKLPNAFVFIASDSSRSQPCFQWDVVATATPIVTTFWNK